MTIEPGELTAIGGVIVAAFTAIGGGFWKIANMVISRFESMQTTQNETNKATNEALLKVSIAVNSSAKTGEQVVSAVDRLDRRLEHVEREFVGVQKRVEKHEKAITGEFDRPRS